MSGHMESIPTQPPLAMPYVTQREALTVIIGEEFEAKLQRAMDLGFERRSAMEVLATCNDDVIVEVAVEHLVGL